MAVTSQWEWVTINRAIETQNYRKKTVVHHAGHIEGHITYLPYNEINYSDVKRERNNWTVSRKRISDGGFVSDLGSTVSSLTAYNGGVEETVSGEQLICISDAQTYESRGVVWYTQTQTWVSEEVWNYIEPLPEE